MADRPGGDPKAIATLQPRRSGRLPAALAAARQCSRSSSSPSLPLAEVKPLLEARFGNWAAPAVAKGVKSFAAPPPRPAAPKILLINRPGCAAVDHPRRRSCIPVDPRGDIIPLDAANDVLGGDFLSRLNMDLREDKGWSYGVSGRERAARACGAAMSSARRSRPTAPANSLAELNAQIDRLPDDQGRDAGGARADGRQAASTSCPASSRRRARCSAR